VPWIEGLAAALEASALGAFARGSAYGYPLANLVHLLGLVLLIGGIGLVDLRFLGLFRRLPAGYLAQTLIPWAAAGVVLLFFSGFVMFSADARPLLRSDTFLWKLALIAIALVNLAVFHRLWGARLQEFDRSVPQAIKVVAASSIALWLSAATLGRMIAYS